MIWFYKKLSEDEFSILYSYIWEDEESTPGQILYDKKSKEAKVIKVASNNDIVPSWCAVDKFEVVIRDGFPEKRTVMIG